MKKANTYVCLVDTHRRCSLSRNTRGRYLVGAKTPKEAKQKLQKAIGFGSVQVYYQVKPDFNTNVDQFVNYGEIFKVEPTGELIPARHANAPIPEYDKE